MGGQRLAEHSAALIGCLAWLPLALWIVACVHWMIDGDIDFLTGILGILMAFGLGYEAINPPVPEMAPLTVIAILLTVVMFPFVRRAMDKRQLRQIDVEALERAYQALAVRPDNVIAKIKVAQKLFDLGICGHALRIAEILVPEMPQRFFSSELRMVKKWQRLGLDARFFTPIVCVECRSSYDPGALFCSQCGAPFPLDFVKGRLIGTKLGRKLISSWVALIAILIGIPEARALPPAAAVATVCLMMLVALGVVFFAFRDPSGGVVQ